MRHGARRALVLAIVLAAASCTSQPSPTGEGVASPTATASGYDEAAPGLPYDAATLLAAMRDSRRPGGVPDPLETDAIAQALASQIWTWDGRPWSIIAVGGACAPRSCTLEIVGSREGAAGTDFYAFDVDADGTTTLVTADLHAYDAALDELLDRAARSATGDELAGFAYVGAGWLPPPDAGVYRLAYRTGGEEGAPGIDLLLHLASGRVVDREPR